MTVIPQFIVKRMYVSGSLRYTEGGLAFDLKNTLGPGILTQVNGISVGGEAFTPNQITLEVGEQRIAGESVSEAAPVSCQLNQTVTCYLSGPTALAPGQHKITMDLLSKEAGKVVISIQDTLQ